MKTEIHARLRPEDYNRLKEIASECDTILSEAVRQAIAFYIQVYDFPADRKNRIGVNWEAGYLSLRFPDFEDEQLEPQAPNSENKPADDGDFLEW